MKRNEYKYKPSWSRVDEFKLRLLRVLRSITFKRTKPPAFEGLVNNASAWKVAKVTNIEYAWFEGISYGLYTLSSTANCIRSGWHRAPAYWCSCGFYSLKNKVNAYKLFNRVRSRDKVFLQVELYGNIIDHDLGFRSEEQVITKVYLPGQCKFKKCTGKTVGLSKNKRILVSSCARHMERGYTLSKLSQIWSLPVSTISPQDFGGELA